MRYEKRRALIALTVAIVVVLGGATTALADETTPGEASREEPESSRDSAESDSESKQNEEAAGSAIVDPANTGLQLGSGESSADDALANLDEARANSSSGEADGGDSDDASSDERHPCEPYPSCARANLGSISDDQVTTRPFQSVAQSNADEIRKCYAGALNENASGRIVFAFEIDSGGEAREIELKESSFDSDAARKCARKAVSNWDFPKPAEFGYESLKVTHPFTFRSE